MTSEEPAPTATAATSRVPIQAIRGVRDILPLEAPTWQAMERAARAAFEPYGYREVRLPIFERTELFARGIGETTDIVEKEMYSFQDKSGESVTLRVLRNGKEVTVPVTIAEAPAERQSPS